MILDMMIRPKRLFDVGSKKDVSSYTKFLRTGSWGHDGCPYVLEFPYLTIPDMIKDKLIHKFLKVKKVTYESRNQ
jgi:hypothetical protein